MTIKQLSKYHDIKKEIKQLEDSIFKLKSIISSSKISEMSAFKNLNAESPTEKLAIKIVNSKDKLEKKKHKLIDELNKIEDFLDKVEDSEIRIIIRERFINGNTWDKVGRIINSDRTTPYYKLINYLKNSERNRNS